MKPSTKQMFRKHGWRVDRALHNYLYFLYYLPYVKGFYRALSLVERRLTGIAFLAPAAKAIIDRYHAKILSLEDTRKILSLNRDVHVTSDRNKSVIPFRYAYRIIFEAPEHVVVMDCPCKLSMDAPPETIRSCLAVGKPLSDFWLDHCQKYHPQRISPEEAFDLVKRFRATGHITQAFFKVATGGSTGVLCNCHPDSCVSLLGTRVAKKLDPSLSQSAPSGYAVHHNPHTCALCRECVGTCHFGAIRVHAGAWRYDRNLCMGCELCVEKCPAGALTLVRDPNKPLPLDMDLIREWADHAPNA